MLTNNNHLLYKINIIFFIVVYSRLMEIFKIDDPCDSFAVHAGAGFCGKILL